MLTVKLTENELSIVIALVSSLHSAIIDDLSSDKLKSLDIIVNNLALLQHTESIMDKLMEVSDHE